MKKVDFVNITWKEGKHHVAQCLNIDVSSFGKTKGEALRNLREAIELYVEDMPASHIAKIEKPSMTVQSVHA